MKDKSTLMNPFPGLRSFRSDEDYLFFGREEQTRELMARLERHRFIAVVGTSGRGKSSLVRCGLLSRLQGGGMVAAGAHWEIAVMHPGGDPFRQLAQALLDADLHDREAEDAVPHLLATLRRSHFGLVQAVKQANLRAGTNFLLVVDQFEEIFRYDEAGAAESEQANDFIAMLLEAAAQTEVPIYIVTTMRSDFIGDCSRFEGLAQAVNHGEYLVPGLTRDQFKSAIEGPVRVAGGQIAPRLLQRLLNDVGEEQDQLPCLQHALMRTWRVWQDRAGAEALDLEDYAQVGKMSQALSVHADEIYFGFATDRQRELCGAMFKALTVEGSEKRGIRRPRRLQTLCGILGVDKGELIPVIDAFRHPEVSFLMPPLDVALTDGTVVDLSHESLMRVWTRLRDWVDEEAKSVGIFRRLSESAALWRQGKTGFLRDPELSIARAWAEASRPNAAWAGQYDGRFEDAMAYLAASTEAAEKEVRDQEAARERELAQAKALAEAERTRAQEQTAFAARLKWLVRGLGLVAMVAVAAMIIAFASRREAQQNAKVAQDAEARAQAVGQMADTARSQAERLVAFLLDDFYVELEPTGRLDMMARLAKQAIAYYDGLPPELRSRETRRNRAIAQVHHADAIIRQGAASEGLDEAAAAAVVFEQLLSSGDTAEVTTVALILAVRAQATAFRSLGRLERALAAAERAVALALPLAAAPGSSRRNRVIYAEALLQLAIRTTENEKAMEILREARQVAQDAGGSDFTDLSAAGVYASICDHLGRNSSALQRIDDAERFHREGLAVANRILDVRPGDRRAMGSRGAALYFLCQVEGARSNYNVALELFADTEDALLVQLRYFPTDAVLWGNLVVVRQQWGNLLLQRGRIEEGIAKLRRAFNVVNEQKTIADVFDRGTVAAGHAVAGWEARRGNRVAAEAAMTEANRLRKANQASIANSRGSTPLEVSMRIVDLEAEAGRRSVEYLLDNLPAVIADAERIRAQFAELRSNPAVAEAARRTLETTYRRLNSDMGRAFVRLGRFAEAEQALREALPPLNTPEERASVARPDAYARVWLALAMVRRGNAGAARELLAPAMKIYQDQAAKGDDTVFNRWNVALCLYVRSLMENGAERRASLQEAAALLDGLSVEAKQLDEARLYIPWIAEQLAKLPARTE